MTFKVDVETVDPVRCRLAVEVPAEEVTAEIDRAYIDLSRSAKVRGFRPGRVPRNVLERLFGDRVRADVFAKLIQQSYAEVIEERRIEALGQPEIVTEQAQPGVSLRYSATVEVKPDLVVGTYIGLEAERPSADVSEADVNTFIEGLRQSLAQLRPITNRSQVEDGDVVTLDYEARVDARLLGQGENRQIEVGANGFPPAFDAQLRGASVGTELDFELPYPADYEMKDLAGRTARFHVRLRSLSHKELPILDDEFAKDHGECSTLTELRQRVRHRLEAEAAQRAEEAVRGALLTALANANDIPVPNALVHRRTDALIEEVLHQWQQQKIRPKNESAALARLREDLQPRAQQQVKVALLLEAIARQEGIAVRDDDVEQRIAALAVEAGSAADRVRALYQDPEARRQLQTRMVQSRAVDVVVARARITHAARQASVAETSENR